MSARGVRAGVGIRSLRFRIAMAFAAAVGALLGAQAFLLWQNQQVSRSLTMITEGYLPLAKTVAQLERDRARVDNDVRRLLRDAPRPGTGPASPAVIYTEQLQENLEIGRIVAQHAQRLDLPPREKAVFHKATAQLDRIEELFREYQDLSTRIVTLAERGERDEAQALAEPLTRNGKLLGEEIDKLSRALDARTTELTQATEQEQVRATAIAGVLTVSAFGLSFAILGAALVALGPIGRLTSEVQRLAAGDYSGRVDVRGGDEVAVLAGEFNAMVQALQLRDRTLVERADALNRMSGHLSRVLDSLDDPLLVFEGGSVTLANPAARRVWGAREGAAPVAAIMGLLTQPGRHEITGPGRTLHEVRVNAFGLTGAVVVSADVTEQTRAKEALARSERLALVGQMLAQITHEVRNPLNALSLNAELLAEELARLDPDRDSEAWDLLATVSGEIERLTAVTGHYLQLARRPPAQLAPTSLGALVDEVERLLVPELDQHGAALTVRVEPVGPQLVDGNQLKQALINVVRNAVESGATGLVLTLEHRPGEVALSVADDGHGMTEEEVARACDPFFSTKASGTGLGLAITRQILEDHGGAVAVSSTPGQGTRVTLALPDRPATSPTRTEHVADDPRR